MSVHAYPYCHIVPVVFARCVIKDMGNIPSKCVIKDMGNILSKDRARPNGPTSHSPGRKAWVGQKSLWAL